MTKKTYKSARGQIIDLDNLRLKNEKSIAVGNMKVNARGDELGKGGKVVKGRNQVMGEFYAKKGTKIKEKVTQIKPDAFSEAGDYPPQTKEIKKPVVAKPATQMSKQEEQAPALTTEKKDKQLRGSLARHLKEKMNNESSKN